MKKLKNLLAAAIMVFSSSFFITSCKVKESLYLLPTENGKKYLQKDSKIIKNGAKDFISDLSPEYADDIPSNSSNDDAYVLNVDASAVQNEGISFKTDGESYSENTIDVLLFNIGTNFNNTSTASTLLYSSLTPDGDETAAQRELVTGVSYDYGTGPIQNKIGVEQKLCIRTTVMEKSGGEYIEAPDIATTYKFVYLKLVDTSAPILYDFQTGLDYADYVKHFKHDYFEDYLKYYVSQYFTYENRNTIDGTDRPEINELTITNKQDEYYTGDFIKGTFNVKDASGNISNDANILIQINESFNLTKVYSLSYNYIIGTYVKGADGIDNKEDAKDYIRNEMMYELNRDNQYNQLTLEKDDIEIENFDEFYDNVKNNLKDLITNKEYLTLKIKIKGYKYSAESEAFPFKIEITDDVAPGGVVLDLTEKLNFYDNMWSFPSIETMIAGYVNTFTSIKDDFKDDYYLRCTFSYTEPAAYDRADTDNNEILTRYYIKDSSDNYIMMLSDVSKPFKEINSELKTELLNLVPYRQDMLSISYKIIESNGKFDIDRSTRVVEKY